VPAERRPSHAMPIKEIARPAASTAATVVVHGTTTVPPVGESREAL
jgi:hypothetical protein